MVPNILPGFFSGALFAFIASFDNYPISMFLVDVRTKTLPITMQGIPAEQDMVGASSEHASGLQGEAGDECRGAETTQFIGSASCLLASPNDAPTQAKLDACKCFDAKHPLVYLGLDRIFI